MLQSMTGYGKSICELPDKNLIIEIKSLNSKQLDLNHRIPQVYREKELAIRNIVAEKLIRGKVELSIFVEYKPGTQTKSLNKGIIKAYYKQITEINKDLNIQDENILASILKLPDVVTVEIDSIDENEWTTIEKSVKEAVSDIVHYRIHEGEALKKDLLKRISLIRENLDQIKEIEGRRIEKVKERILQSLEDIVSNDKIDKNRFEQELIFYLEKLDITEEKVRLTQHCSFFEENINIGSPIGKKLNFISQEIGREINTIGSKANDADMQRYVVLMKDELEKIKEQSLNIL